MPGFWTLQVRLLPESSGEGQRQEEESIRISLRRLHELPRISKLAVKRSDCTGYSEWRDNSLNAFTLVGWEDRMSIKVVVQAIIPRGNLPFDELDHKPHWSKSKVAGIAGLGTLNKELHSFLITTTNRGAWLRIRVVDMGEGVAAYVTVYI